MAVEIDKRGSVTSRIELGRKVDVLKHRTVATAGDIVAARAITESVTYGNLELPSGRLARINRGDVLLGALGKRRALKGFVGEVPQTVAPGDRLHVLNMGGVIGECTGHHSSLSDAIELEVIGLVANGNGTPLNIRDGALQPASELSLGAPIVMVA